MYKSNKKLEKSDIYSMYNMYWTYKEYYSFYWKYKGSNNVTKEDIKLKIKNIIDEKRKLGGPIEALCFYANVPMNKLFNSNGTPKDLNEIEVLDMIMEANYGETNE